MAANTRLPFLLFVLVFLHRVPGYIIFTIQPEPLTALYSKELTFRCAAENANDYHWLVNGTNDVLYDPGIDFTSEHTVESGITGSTLTIFPPHDPAKLNNTYVQCVAVNHSVGAVTADFNTSKPALVQIQGKLDPPEVKEVIVDCPSKTVFISWIEPRTLEAIYVTGYEICGGQNCVSVSNTTLSWTAKYENASVASCEVVVTRVTAVIEGDRGHYANISTTFTQAPMFVGTSQIQSKVSYLPQSQMFQIEYRINLMETNNCHLPDSYSVIIYNVNKEEETKIQKVPYDYITSNGFIGQVIKLNVTGQERDVFTTLEPGNCVGSNTSSLVNNSLFHLQLVDVNPTNSYISCTFVTGSDAIGCQTVLTCTKVEAGKTKPPPVICPITKSDPSLRYAAGDFVCEETSNCLEYSVSVYEVYSDGSIGGNAVKTISNITFPEDVLPPLYSSPANDISMPKASQSSTATPISCSEDGPYSITMYVLLNTLVVVVVDVSAIVIVRIVYVYYKNRKYRKHIQHNEQHEMIQLGQFSKQSD